MIPKGNQGSLNVKKEVFYPSVFELFPYFIWNWKWLIANHLWVSEL
jgi:hypothetical protein